MSTPLISNVGADAGVEVGADVGVSVGTEVGVGVGTDVAVDVADGEGIVPVHPVKTAPTAIRAHLRRKSPGPDSLVPILSFLGLSLVHQYHLSEAPRTAMR